MLFGLAVTGVASRCAAPTGAVEEHFALGQELRATGSLGGGVLRPPGYPAFVASILWLRDLTGVGSDDTSTVIAAQRLCLMLVSLILFHFVARNGTPRDAFLVGGLMWVNPLSMTLAGALTYPMLDAALITAGAAVVLGAMSVPRPRTGLCFGAGLLWGLAALVRPVCLILPVFVAALAWLGGRWTGRDGARVVGIFSIGMAVVVAPYVARNYRVSGRVVPVSAQAGFALWASTAASPPSDEDYTSWRSTWERQGLPIFARVTGHAEYTLPVFSAYASTLNDAFAKEAIRNLRRDPWTYASNVANNLWRFPLDSSSWWWRRFSWENAGRPMNGIEAAAPSPRARRAARLASAFVVAQSLLGLAGLVVGLRRGDPRAGPVLAMLAAFWIGSSLTLLLSRYTYVKLPLLVFSTGLLFREGTTPSPLARWAVAALLALAVASTLTLILAAGTWDRSIGT